jgi:hypothetical protein
MVWFLLFYGGVAVWVMVENILLFVIDTKINF